MKFLNGPVNNYTTVDEVLLLREHNLCVVSPEQVAGEIGNRQVLINVRNGQTLHQAHRAVQLAMSPVQAQYLNSNSLY